MSRRCLLQKSFFSEHIIQMRGILYTYVQNLALKMLRYLLNSLLLLAKIIYKHALFTRSITIFIDFDNDTVRGFASESNWLRFHLNRSS